MLKEYSVTQDHQTITVTILRSSRKSIGLEISADLKVKLRVPHYVSDKEIKKVLEGKKDWIFDKYRLLAERRSSLPIRKQRYYEGMKLPLGETEITLLRKQVVDSKTKKVPVLQEESGHKILYLFCDFDSQEELRCAIVDFYKEYARKMIQTRTKKYADLMHLSINKITIREQKTRWGSCSSNGNLNFNWKLMMMPERILDYVIVHELSHLKQMNHSKLFWNEIEKVLPDYKLRKNWLKKHGKDYQIY